MFHMFKFFQDNPSPPSSLTFTSTAPRPKNIFRGSTQDFLEANIEDTVDRVEVSGKKVAEGVYDSSFKPSATELSNFMKKVDSHKIKELSFDGCTLSPEAGNVIGKAIKKNKTLEFLEVCSSQLEHKGMMGLLCGLKENNSIKTFVARSYNVRRYYWSTSELKSLASVISTNSTIEKIELPNNQLNEFSDINFLTQPYKDITDRRLATIYQFAVSMRSIPPICSENIDELNELSGHRFSKGY